MRQTCPLPMPSVARFAEYVPPDAGSEAASTSLFAHTVGSPPLSESSHSSTSCSPASPDGAVTVNDVPSSATSRNGTPRTTVAVLELTAVHEAFVTVPALNAPLPVLATNRPVARS